MMKELVKSAVLTAIVFGLAAMANAQGTWTVVNPAVFVDWDGSNPDINWACDTFEVKCINGHPAGIRFDYGYDFGPPAHPTIAFADTRIQVVRRWGMWTPGGWTIFEKKLYDAYTGEIGVDESESGTIEVEERFSIAGASYHVTAVMEYTQIDGETTSEVVEWGAEVPNCNTANIIQ